jgi:hypothetical protein
MANRRTRKSKSLALKSMELAAAVPQVVAHRVTRMALAGPSICSSGGSPRAARQPSGWSAGTNPSPEANINVARPQIATQHPDWTTLYPGDRRRRSELFRWRRPVTATRLFEDLPSSCYHPRNAEVG